MPNEPQELTTASPMVVGPADFNLSSKGHNQNTLKDLMSKKSLHELKGFVNPKLESTLYTTDNNTNAGTGRVFLRDNVAKTITYYMSFRKLKVLGRPALRQIKVWRNPKSLATKGLSENVFFQYLIPKFGTVAADTAQTEAGKEFWLRRLSEAIPRFHVYGVNMLSKKAMKVSSEADLDLLEPIFWSEGSKSMHMVPIITTEPLSERFIMPANKVGLR